jgi:type II secretory pathway component PulM
VKALKETVADIKARVRERLQLGFDLDDWQAELIHRLCQGYDSVMLAGISKITSRLFPSFFRFWKPKSQKSQKAGATFSTQSPLLAKAKKPAKDQRKGPEKALRKGITHQKKGANITIFINKQAESRCRLRFADAGRPRVDFKRDCTK